VTRKEYIKLCGILGIGLPFQSLVSSCSNDLPSSTGFSGKVIIIGAGAGGLTSGYLLNQLGVDFDILEASSLYGGRMRTNTSFADFPLPLGAEWLHTSTNIFQEIVNDDTISVDVKTIGYNEEVDTVGDWQNGEFIIDNLKDSDRKFINSTWFDFFEKYILPSVQQRITFNTVVNSIDYSGNEVVINTSKGQLSADKIIISVPLKILQDGDISFSPNLPDDKLESINNATIWEGFKAFIEFSDKFYHTATSFEINPEEDGQKLYYDASYGQNSSKHILGLFVVGKPALEYISKSGDQLRDFMLNELDEIYTKQASPNYIKHIIQNWSNEPFIRAGYLTDHANWRQVRKLSESVSDKVYFAGGPYTSGNDWVSVHAAAQSAKDAVSELVK